MKKLRLSNIKPRLSLFAIPSEYKAEFIAYIRQLNMWRFLLVACIVLAGELISLFLRLKSGINYAASGSLLAVTTYKVLYSFLFILAFVILHRKKNKDGKAAQAVIILFTISFLFIQLYMTQYEFSQRGTLYNYLFGIMLLAIALVSTNLECILYVSLYSVVMFGVVHGFQGIQKTSFNNISYVIIMTIILFVASRMFYISQLRNFLDKKKLAQNNKTMEQLSMTDQLTNINNRRGFYRDLDIILAQSTRQGTGIAFLMADIDSFKKFNDCYGHLYGDRCLVELSKCLQTCFQRKSDCIGRYGGEEFVAAFSPADEHQALLQAENFLHCVEALHIPHELSSVSSYVTISIGVHYCTPDTTFTADDMLLLADKALYQSKHKGGNTATLYTRSD